MKVRIVCYEDIDTWILGKFARKLREELTGQGVTCDIAKTTDPTADINHHIIYYDYDGRKSTCDTVMITHIDTDWKRERIRSQLQAAEMGICMSAETMTMLAGAGIPREKLCYVLPAHDQVMKPRPLVIGLTSKIHNDGRKREYLLPQLAEQIRPDEFMFRIMGMGWDAIVAQLRERGFQVDYYDQFDYDLNTRLVPTFDYYLYLGWDEGAMGFVDALAAGVPTIVTPQGYHLDAPGGITHPFDTLEDLVQVFEQITAKKRSLVSAVAGWTWRDYAIKHLEIWQHLVQKNRPGYWRSSSRYVDGANSIVCPIPQGNNSEQQLLERVRTLLANDRYEEAGKELQKLLLLYPANGEGIALERMMNIMALKNSYSRLK